MGWERHSNPEEPVSVSNAVAQDPQVRPRLWPSWKRALGYARPYKGSVVGIVAMTLLMGSLGALEPLLLKGLFDALTAGEGTEAALHGLGAGLVGLAALTLVREALTGASNWLTWRTRIAVHYDLLDATVSRIHTLPLSYHKGESSGGTLTRLERGIQGFVTALTEISFNVLPAIVYLLTALVVMVGLDWRLSLLVLVFVPLPVLIGMKAAPEQLERDRKLLDRWTRIYARFTEVLAGIVTVKSFTMEEDEKRRFLTQVDEANRIVVRGVGRDSWFEGTKNVVVGVARLAALGLGGWLVVRGETTVGTVVAFMSYAAGLFGPVQGLTGIYQTVARAGVSLDTVFGILDASDHLSDAPDAKPLQRAQGEITFEGVRFRYGDDRPWVLDGIDLHIAKGEQVALVGPSGSGKSTLMALSQRLYDPCEGVVRVDGHDLRDLQQRSVRANIGVVLQDSLLFDDTVRNNIAYGRRDATQAQIEAAARAANAHDFIMALPDGYDTMVGERGGLLSGGQRQRVAIARALLKDPPILILDEATSALDAESEALVQEALGRLVVGRTTLVIAHRLSTIVDADRVIVLKNGRIETTGTHQELMAREGYYGSLVRLQARGLDVAPMVGEKRARGGVA